MSALGHDWLIAYSLKADGAYKSLISVCDFVAVFVVDGGGGGGGAVAINVWNVILVRVIFIVI